MPLTLCLVVLGRHVDRLEFLDALLGDRPALTPIESFYRRILAGDADEAQGHAELLLKDRSLSSYCDEVALKELQLAANDAERGVLHQDQPERIKNTIEGLVAELASHDDRVRAVIGAGYYSTSLRGSVNSCVEAARAASDEAGANPAAPARSGKLVPSRAEAR